MIIILKSEQAKSLYWHIVNAKYDDSIDKKLLRIPSPSLAKHIDETLHRAIEYYLTPELEEDMEPPSEEIINLRNLLLEFIDAHPIESVLIRIVLCDGFGNYIAHHLD